jgi:hypothetical protein
LERAVLDWLFEGRGVVYGLLGMVALALTIIWWRDQRRLWVYALGTVIGLILLYLLLDFAVETDGEQISRHLQGMSKAVREHHPDVALALVADDFNWEGKNKRELGALATGLINNGSLTDVVVWDFQLISKTTGPPHLANVSFRVKPLGNLGGAENMFFICEAQFEQDSKKVWRLKRMRLLDPLRDNVEIKPSEWGGRW